MRVLIYGNSHLSALKYALEEHPLSKRADVDLVFWGVHGVHFPNVTFTDGVLRSSRPAYSLMVSGGRYRELPVSDFDVIVFHACRLDLVALARDFSNAFADPEPYSEAFVTEAIRDAGTNWLRTLPSWNLILRIRDFLPGRRMFVTPQPMHAEVRLKVLKHRSLARRAVCGFQDLIRAECCRLGIEYVPQPLATIREGLATKNEYTVGSMKLNTDREKHPDTDWWHMNVAYGQLVLADLQARILGWDAGTGLPGEAREVPVSAWTHGGPDRDGCILGETPCDASGRSKSGQSGNGSSLG